MHTRLFANAPTSSQEQVKKLFADIQCKNQNLLIESGKLHKQLNDVNAERIKAQTAVKELMVKEKYLKEQISLITRVDCSELKDLFAEKFKSMDNKDVPSDLDVVSCTHDMGNDTMALTVKTADTKFSIGDLLETTILNPQLVGGTGTEYTNSGILQKVILRNYPYNDERDVYQEILEKLTGAKISVDESISVSPTCSPTRSRL